MAKEYKIKRLRDGEILILKHAHALNLLKLDAKQSKREFEIAEKNYNFSDNEIHRKPNVRDTEKTEASNKD